MELLVIFIIISVLEKIFKTKKEQKKIQEARKKRMETFSPSQTQNQPQTSRQKPKSLADRIKEEIEKGYENLSTDIPKSEKIEEKNIIKKKDKVEKDRRYITDYDAAYEVYDGKGTLQGKEYKGDKYFSEYDKPYETHGRKTGTQEGKEYKERDESFYNRREKKIPIMDEKAGISIENQIVMGIIYSEILGKPKSKR